MKINNFNTYPVLNRLYCLLYVHLIHDPSGVACLEYQIMFITVSNSLAFTNSGKKYLKV